MATTSFVYEFAVEQNSVLALNLLAGSMADSLPYEPTKYDPLYAAKPALDEDEEDDEDEDEDLEDDDELEDDDDLDDEEDDEDLEDDEDEDEDEEDDEDLEDDDDPKPLKVKSRS